MNCHSPLLSTLLSLFCVFPLRMIRPTIDGEELCFVVMYLYSSLVRVLEAPLSLLLFFSLVG